MYLLKKEKLDTYPFSDADMIWDKDLKMYKLTDTYIKKFVEIRYKDKEKFNREMNRISMNMYDYCYTESCKYNDAYRIKKDTLEYRFAKDHKYRDVIKQALLKFVKFDDATDGGTDAGYYGLDNGFKDNIAAWLEQVGLVNKSRLTIQYDIDEEGVFDEKTA